MIGRLVSFREELFLHQVPPPLLNSQHPLKVTEINFPTSTCLIDILWEVMLRYNLLQVLITGTSSLVLDIVLPFRGISGISALTWKYGREEFRHILPHAFCDLVGLH